MLYKILNFIDRRGYVESASAHCDIPCGIYDPMPALIAAVSVLRIMDIMNESAAKGGDTAALHNMLARNALRKEEEAEKVKHEIRIIWGDYFKGDLLTQHPDIHSLTHSIMLKGSACKQDVHREDGEALVELVNQFAEKFWETKGKKTQRLETPYAPNVNIVHPIL